MNIDFLLSVYIVSGFFTGIFALGISGIYSLFRYFK